MIRLATATFASLALVLSSCQQMSFPWNQSGGSTYDQSGGWGQQQQQQQQNGVQWGQSSTGAWGSQAQQPPQQQQWGQSQSNTGGWGDTSGASTGGWDQSGGQSAGGWGSSPDSGWNATPPPSNTSSWGSSTGAASSGGSGRTHVVSRGDTLTSISSRYGSSVRRIMQANGISDPNRIGIGQRLAIP